MDPPRTARDLMVTRLVTVSPDTNVLAGIHLMLERRITGAPVVDAERNYLGMLSEKCCLGVLTLTAQLAAEAGESTATDTAADFMKSRLVTFSPDTDGFKAVELLLRNRVSGAPVVDDDGRFLGVFSERYAMSLLIQSAYDGVPSARVAAFMNTDQGRTIEETTPLLEVARMFLDKYYRRLPVLREGRLVGQVSRRDVLAAEHHLTPLLRQYEGQLLERSGELYLSDVSAPAAGTRLASSDIGSFMDREAPTIDEETDLLTIAQIFQTTNARRLPVIKDGKLEGQVSRRDVLAAAHELMSVAPKPERALLYLSAVVERSETPPIG